MATVINSEKISFQQAHYTPRNGWIEYPKRPEPIPLILTEDEILAITMAKRKEGEHTMTADQKKTITTLRKKGASAGAIAGMLNISINTVNTHLRRHPVDVVETGPEGTGGGTRMRIRFSGRRIPRLIVLPAASRSQLTGTKNESTAVMNAISNIDLGTDGRLIYFDKYRNRY